jgi:hypothetical protein
MIRGFEQQAQWQQEYAIPFDRKFLSNPRCDAMRLTWEIDNPTTKLLKPATAFVSGRNLCYELECTNLCSAG